MPEWSRYTVGAPSTRTNWTERTCQPLRWVYHVAHLETARRIVSDGAIRAGLVFDQSRLNRERNRVVWLSPNTWYRGSRYGNVAFAYSWPRVLQDYRAYWVEVMTEYNPHAPRILLTRTDYSGKLEPYDPTGPSGRGPWWYDSDSGMHYWNGAYTLEFMLEDDLPLSSASKITFGDHHPTFCSVDPTSCPELGLSEHDASARFIALLVAQNLVPPSGLLTQMEDGRAVATSDLRGAVQWLWPTLRDASAKHAAVPAPESARPALARALLQAVATENAAELGALAALFSSQEEMFISVEHLLRSFFALDQSVDFRWRPWLTAENDE